MEQPNTIFSLSIDPVTKSHLSEAAKWARFLAIVGMISLALLVLIGFYMSTMMAASFNERMQGNGSKAVSLGVGIGMAFIYLVMAVIWFFPLMYLLRFANQMRTAIESNDQENLNNSFQNLKICFRYLGIVTIIGIIVYLLFFVIVISTQINLGI